MMKWLLNQGRCGMMEMISIALLAAAPASGRAVAVYSIQGGAYTTEDEAAQRAEELSASCSPVFVAEVKDSTGFPYKVRVGHFVTYADAWAHKEKLPSDLVPGGFVARWDWDGRDLKYPELPVAAPFRIDGMAEEETELDDEYWRAGGFPRGNRAGIAMISATQTMSERDRLLAAGEAAPAGDVDGRHSLEQFIQKYPSDREINRARLMLARVLGRGEDPASAGTLLQAVRQTGGHAEATMADFVDAHVRLNLGELGAAYENFSNMASRVDVPVSIRREAMRRAAGVAHRARRYPDAWLAFGQLERAAADTETVAEARLQRAGLALELAGMGKGTHEEARMLCRHAAATPGIPRRTLATALLMHLETYYWDDMIEEGLAETEAFCAQFADVPREYHAARVWLGLYLHRAGESARAVTVMREVMASTIPQGEWFAGKHPPARAAVWLAWMADTQGEPQLRDECIQFLDSKYPDSEEARYAARIFPAKTR